MGSRGRVARGITADYHLKIDSGMGRLGTRRFGAEILEAIGAREACRGWKA